MSEEESIICVVCGRSFKPKPENLLYFAEGEMAYICPKCGSTNIGVQIKTEAKIIEEVEYDVDEEEWLKKHPEQAEQEVR